MPMIGYLAFAGVDWDVAEERVELLPAVFGGPPRAFSLPPVLDEHRHPHGENAVEAYEHAGLIASREHPEIEVGSVEFRVRTEIERDLEYCRVALMLVVPSAKIESFLAIESLEKTGERVMRRTKAILPWFAGRGDGGWFVDPNLWAQAAQWVAAIVSEWRGKHVHMAHALWSFEHACARREYDDRYELFCRAIETVLQTESGQGARQFAEGVRLVLGDGHGLPSVDSLESHYRRRNEIVHGHRFLDAETDGDRVVLEMEELARAFMQRLLTDQAMFEKVMCIQEARVEARRAKAERKAQEGATARRSKRARKT